MRIYNSLEESNKRHFEKANSEYVGRGAANKSEDKAGDPLTQAVSGLLRQINPLTEESREARRNSEFAKKTADDTKKNSDAVFKRLEEAEKKLNESSVAANGAASAAERALPNILTVMSILIAAIIAVVCVYLSTILGRLSSIESSIALKLASSFLRVSYKQFAFLQLLTLGQIVFNTAWFFVYLCSKMIDRLRWTSLVSKEDEKKLRFLSPNFITLVVVINAAFFAVAIIVRVCPNLLFS